MTKRSDIVLVYEYHNIKYCRICAGIPTDTNFRGDVCRTVTNHKCCVFGNDHDRSTRYFDFNNTKHKIRLSFFECNLCFICDGMDNCILGMRDIVNTFMSNIHKVKKE